MDTQDTKKTEFFTIQRYGILRGVAKTEEAKSIEGELETRCMFCLEDFKDQVHLTHKWLIYLKNIQ